jgi:hypothetical protein
VSDNLLGQFIEPFGPHPATRPSTTAETSAQL